MRCSQTQYQPVFFLPRYSVSLDETRHALMLVLRQYARHWHATRRLSSNRLAAVGGSPKRVRARTADRWARASRAALIICVTLLV